MLTREDHEKICINDNPNLLPDEVNRIVNARIEERHGDEVGYKVDLATHRAKEEEEKPFEPEYDKDLFKAMQTRFEAEDKVIRNPEALEKFEAIKANLLRNDWTKAEAESYAKIQIQQDFGNDMYVDPAVPYNLDHQIERLLDAGAVLSVDAKEKVKHYMKNQAMSAPDALLKYETERQENFHNFNKQLASEGERALDYLNALTIDEQEALGTLRGIQPESNWTAKKLYKNIHNGKSLPRKPVIPKEEMVSWEQYEQEQRKAEELKKILSSTYGITVE